MHTFLVHMVNRFMDDSILVVNPPRIRDGGLRNNVITYYCCRSCCCDDDDRFSKEEVIPE